MTCWPIYPPVAAGTQIAYGTDPLQFGELHVPAGEGPFPVVIFIHGGCWLAEYDITTTRPLAWALLDQGIAVWNLGVSPRR